MRVLQMKMRCHECKQFFPAEIDERGVDTSTVICFECWYDSFELKPEVPDFDEAEWELANIDLGESGA